MSCLLILVCVAMTGSLICGFLSSRTERLHGFLRDLAINPEYVRDAHRSTYDRLLYSFSDFEDLISYDEMEFLRQDTVRDWLWQRELK
mgnify:CR=1 FL=1